MLDAIVWALAATLSVTAVFTASSYILRPWPIARLGFMMVGVPVAYVLGGMIMANTQVMLQQAAIDMLSGGICFQGLALPCLDISGGCSCGSGLWGGGSLY